MHVIYVAAINIATMWKYVSKHAYVRVCGIIAGVANTHTHTYGIYKNFQLREQHKP